MKLYRILYWVLYVNYKFQVVHSFFFKYVNFYIDGFYMKTFTNGTNPFGFWIFALGSIDSVLVKKKPAQKRSVKPSFSKWHVKWHIVIYTYLMIWRSKVTSQVIEAPLFSWRRAPFPLTVQKLWSINEFTTREYLSTLEISTSEAITFLFTVRFDNFKNQNDFIV